MIIYALRFVTLCALLAGAAERLPIKEESHMQCYSNCGRQSAGELDGKPMCHVCAKQYVNAMKIMRRSEPDWSGRIDANITQAEEKLGE